MIPGLREHVVRRLRGMANWLVQTEEVGRIWRSEQTSEVAGTGTVRVGSLLRRPVRQSQARPGPRHCEIEAKSDCDVPVGDELFRAARRGTHVRELEHEEPDDD